jgi:predicted nucleic acid-binding protein
MTSSSSLNEILQPLVLDTSALINLHACTYGEKVLQALPNEIVIPKIVAEELEKETRRKGGERSFLTFMAAKKALTVADMTDDEYEWFGNLVAGPPSLDDGEAATIAIAATRAFHPVIDERKGRTCAAAPPFSLRPSWSLDLLDHPGVVKSLGNQAAQDAIYLALRDGRMRIPAERSDAVIAKIGLGRALDCSSLPGFKKLLSSTRCFKL